MTSTVIDDSQGTVATGQVELIANFCRYREISSAAPMVQRIPDVSELLECERRIVLEPKIDVLVRREFWRVRPFDFECCSMPRRHLIHKQNVGYESGSSIFRHSISPKISSTHLACFRSYLCGIKLFTFHVGLSDLHEPRPAGV